MAAFVPSAPPGPLSLRHSAFSPSRPASHLTAPVPVLAPPARLWPARRAWHCSASGNASLSETFTRALLNKFPNDDISRVLDSFSAAMDGRTLDEGEGTPRRQHATSFVSGLSAEPWLDDLSGPLSWARRLESNFAAIRDELAAVAATPDLQRRGTNVWVPPVVEAANAYGPDWRTLVLQDREWEPTNTAFFPVTTALLRDEADPVPCVEAFFARQAPDTGIKLHTDFCNFILTMHLGLQVPEGKSWIEVGGERRYWEEGKALVFNTSFFHKTMNESTDTDRTVLLIRFWHPELTKVERDAMSFLFDLIADPDTHPSSLEAARQVAEEKAKRPARPPARGFGN